MQGTQGTLSFARIQQLAELFRMNAGILRLRSERPSFQTLLGSGEGLPIVYVGWEVGITVGETDGNALGFCVGSP